MKVILLQNIKGLGKKFEVKDVSDGYANNFLIPKNLVKPATGGEVNKVAEIKKVENQKREKIVDLAKKLDGQSFSFEIKADKNGSVFGSVNKNEIKEAILKAGFEMGELLLDKPIKNLGEHMAEVSFGGGIKAKIKVIVLPRS